MHTQDQINQLQEKLDLLLKKQNLFAKEVQDLQESLTKLKNIEPVDAIDKEEVKEEFKEEVEEKKYAYSRNVSSTKLHRDKHHKILGGVCAGLAKYFGINRGLIRILWLFFSLFMGIGFIIYIILWIVIPSAEKATNISNTRQPQTTKKSNGDGLGSTHKFPRISTDLEKFVGENLINKIGIAILIIGVAIGAKYSIENDLISPLTRIALGYLVGLGLLGFGMKLKVKYENFSAVLVSGAMAILYFITYAAFSFYDLFPQVFAFVLMVVFTVFTVIAALNYNKQVIAHIGLVGAYAVPFLLSEGKEDIMVLFSYMAIINIGILFIAFKKYWKPLYISSFALTWLIFISWFVSNYNADEHFGLALVFVFIFFVTFYLTVLAYKLIQKEEFGVFDIVLLLVNSFIFYGIGYAILDSNETGSELLGLFTLGNALLHFTVSTVVYKQNLGDKNLFYLISGLVLVFITIAIPVQLNGNWVTLLWIGEAALLFWIGRTKKIPIYELLAYPLMLLAFLSVFQDYETINNSRYFNDSTTEVTPIFNIYFLTSMLFVAAFIFINSLYNKKKDTSPLKNNEDLMRIISFSIPAMLLIILYVAFRIEIVNYWDQLYANSAVAINEGDEYYKEVYNNYDLRKFKTIWLINYSLLFGVILSFVNIKKLKNRQLGFINLGLNTFLIVLFLGQGLYVLSELRESFLNQELAEYYNISSFNIGIRYVSFAFVAVSFYAIYKYIQQEFMNVNYKVFFNLLLAISILWIASSELINWLDITGSSQAYKLGLTIFWGVYSLVLISLGIWKNNKNLRIGAIVLFSITLIKLFFYDISHLDTLSKTIVFVSLGILLLIISFLYNKFKHIISDEN